MLGVHKTTAANAGIALSFHAGRPRPGVAEFCRYELKGPRVVEGAKVTSTIRYLATILQLDDAPPPEPPLLNTA